MWSPSVHDPSSISMAVSAKGLTLGDEWMDTGKHGPPLVLKCVRQGMDGNEMLGNEIRETR